MLNSLKEFLIFDIKGHSNVDTFIFVQPFLTEVDF